MVFGVKTNKSFLLTSTFPWSGPLSFSILVIKVLDYTFVLLPIVISCICRCNESHMAYFTCNSICV